MTSKITGNLTLKASPQPSIYGDGTLKLPSTVNFTNTSGNTLITNDSSNTGGTFTIDSYNNMYVQARNDDAQFVTSTTNANGHVIVNAQGTGTSQLELRSSGSNGIQMATSHATGNINIYASNQLSVTSSDDAIIGCGSGKTLNLNGGSIDGFAFLNAPTVNIGNASGSGGVINIGNPTAATTVLGSLTVNGDFIKNNVVNIETKDPISHYNTPAALTNDGGFLIDRNKNDVLAAPNGDPNFVIYLMSQAFATDNFCYVGITSGSKLLTNTLLWIKNNANNEQQIVRVTLAVEDAPNRQKLTLEESLLYGFPVATTICQFYTGTSAYFGYNCQGGFFELCTTNALPNDLNLEARYKNYMELKCGKIQVDNIFDIVEQVAINSNNSTAVNVVNTEVRGVFTLDVQSSLDGGSCAIFNCVKNKATGTFSIMRTVAIQADTGEQVMAKWDSSQKIQLYHDILRSTGTLNTTVNYLVKVGYTKYV